MDHTLKLLKQMAHGIAKQFGTSCEVVIHDLNKDLETSETDLPGSYWRPCTKTLPKYKISFLISHARRTAGF